MDKKGPNMFQVGIIGFFVVLIFVGMLGFSGKLPLPTGRENVNYGQVALWGTLPSFSVQAVLSEVLRMNQNISIVYTEKNRATFSRDIVEALATGKGPDAVILSQEDLLPALDKLALFSYQTVTERDYKNTFIEEGELFLRPEGIVMLPIAVDPLIMYWNRDLFTNAGVATPPTSWGEFRSLALRLTKRNANGDIVESLAPLGEYRNVSNAKKLLSAIIAQAKGSIVKSDGGSLVAGLVEGDPSSQAQGAAWNSLLFFMEFSRPDKDLYTWNRSLPSSRTMFETGDLAVYFGSASEYASIKGKNPHLNFDVAVLPQVENGARATYGQLYGIATLRAARNPAGAQYAALLLSGQNAANLFARSLSLPPARRDLLAVPHGDAVGSVNYRSALIARGWLDPDKAETDTLLATMVDDIESGRLKISQALTVAQGVLNRLLMPYRQ